MTSSAATVTEAVLDAVRETVAEVNPTSHATITLDSALDRDLGLDSLVRAELLMRIEDAVGVRLPDSVVVDAETPRDFIDAALRASLGSDLPGPETDALRRLDATAVLPADVRTLLDALDWHVSVHPDRVHVRLLAGDSTTSSELTYAALRDRGNAIASGLLASDVRRGDAVAIMLPTSLEYFAAFVGVLAAGGVPVPLYPPARLAQLDDYLRRQIGILDNCRAVAIITSVDVERVARVLRGPVASLRLVRTVDALAHTATVEARLGTRADDVALLQYTSGSTGAPKGVVLTHRDLLANIRAMARAASADASDVFVSWLPLYHDMGLIGAWLGSLCVGFPLVVMSPLSFLARPERWLRAISDHGATLSASPNFGFELCARKIRDDDLRGIDLSSLRMLFNGAEPVSAETLERFQSRFGPYGLHPNAVAPVYGLAEAAVGLAFPPPDRGPVVDRIEREPLVRSALAVPAGPDDHDVLRVVACGRPLPGYEIRVVDSAGNVLGDRHEGRIEFRGPSATRGYFRDPEETRRLFHGDWLDTGDLGYLAGGDIYLTGRAKDLIIRAGRNLHPEELENAVGALPGVRAGCVAAFASRDPTAGTDRLVVAAETREHDPAARERIRAAIVDVTVDVLGTPPDDVVLLDARAVPKTSSGKIRRAACRDLYENERLGRPQHHPRVALARIGLHAWFRRARDARHSVVGLAYASYGWALALVLGVPTAIVLLLAPRRSWRFAILRRALQSLARLAGITVTVSAREHLRQHDGAVVVANHASWIDGALLASVLPDAPVFVVAGELAHAAWAGPFLRRLGVEYVQRATHTQGAADTRRLIAAGRAGRTLVIFPEGRLSHVAGIRAFRLGAFLTAVEARVPVLPVAIRGSRSLLAPGHRMPRRAPVCIEVAAPVTTERPGWNGAVELQHAAREWIVAHCGEPDIA